MNESININEDIKKNCRKYLRNTLDSKYLGQKTQETRRLIKISLFESAL